MSHHSVAHPKVLPRETKTIVQRLNSRQIEHGAVEVHKSIVEGIE